MLNSKNIEFESKALALINEAKIPVSVDYIARQLDTAWDTSRSILLGLAAEGRIKALRTMHGWVFSRREETAKEAMCAPQNKRGDVNGTTQD